MKGFPNQVADLAKLAAGIRAAAALVDRGANAKDDGVFGRQLVHAGVAGTGHVPMPVEDYIRAQLKKPIGGQSFRTSARGLRELFRLLGLIDDSGPTLTVTALGREAAGFAGQPMDDRQIAFWRRVISNMEHSDAQGTSHPYQVLLRLVGRRPGITRAKCALALEARDDSPGELDRIVALADEPEARIRTKIGASKSNWDNAKKILPRFAEQLGDVIKTGQCYVLADAPGHAEAPAGPADPAGKAGAGTSGARAPHASRRVTADQIGLAGTGERGEPAIPPDLDPAAAAAAIAIRADRLRRHNLLVRKLAAILAGAGAALYEDPFDILAIFADLGLLVEVKTLDGSEPDERDRVRSALAQLLYYEAFVTAPVTGGTAIRKLACFERRPSAAHSDWLNRQAIGALWESGTGFGGDDLARKFLGGCAADVITD